MAKRITVADKATEKLMAGVDKLANTVRKTLGPKGRLVIFRQGLPIFSLDGVTVANQIELEDKVEAIGCDLVKDIASRTDMEAGDGTTTATLLAQEILREGLRIKAAGIDMIGVRNGLDIGLKIVVDYLKKMAKPVRTKADIANVGTIASRDPEIGGTIADILKRVGNDAVITAEESKVLGLHKEIVEGLQFDQGFISPYMMTDSEHGQAVIENAHVLVTAQNIVSNGDILKLLEFIARTDSKSLVVVADDVGGEALATLVLNKMHRILKVAAVKAPGLGDNKKEQLMDISVITGAKYIAEEVGLKVEDVELDDLGMADSVIISKDETVIIGGKGRKKDIAEQIKSLGKLIELEKSDYQKELMKKRLAKLKGGVAILRVGTISPQENKEKRYRIEDAVRATKAAIEEGIVPGGGMALIYCSEEVGRRMESEDDLGVRTGLDILRKAIQEPARQIIQNTGKKADVILAKAREMKKGYNSATGEYVDLVKAGIIDPVKVIRCGLKNAVSVVSLFLVTEAVIVDAPEKEEKKS